VASDRYVPRAFAIDDQLFGKQRVIKWRPSDGYTDQERDQLRGSQLQHLVSNVIREALARSTRLHSAADYARAVDVSERRMGALLRGDVVMRLEDIAAAERVLKVTFFDGRADGGEETV